MTENTKVNSDNNTTVAVTKKIWAEPEIEIILKDNILSGVDTSLEGIYGNPFTSKWGAVS